MRIAQVAPLYESVPPQLYGGTERVVSYLTEELVRQGHRVTLFASGDSATRAELIAPRRKALRLDSSCVDQFACHLVLLEHVFREAHRFDSFDQFKAAIDDCLDKMAAEHRHQAATLFTHKFQRFEGVPFLAA